MTLPRGIIAVLAFLLLASGPVHAQTAPPDTLGQYVSQLQKTPDDEALRERIIKFVHSMNQPPALPEEARQACIEGQTFFRLAKEQRGQFDLSIDAYRHCLLAAPWLPEGYNNYALALEAAGRFDEAISAMRLYILTNPGEADARRAQDKIYEMGAQKKLAAVKRSDAASPTPVSATPGASAGTSASPASAFDALKRKIDGRRYTYRDVVGNVNTLEVRGNFLQRRANGADWGRFEIQARSFTCSSPLRPDEQYTFTIGEEGDRITLHVTRRSDGASGDFVYLWQR